MCWFWAAFLGIGLALTANVEARKSPPIDSKFQRCLTRDQVTQERQKSGELLKLEKLLHKLPPNSNKIWLVEFYNGSHFNPNIFGVDAKMALYCVGAVMLQLNILSMAVLHYQNNGGIIANVVKVYVFMFTWFILEYSFFENVHLYTYDLFAEKVGFKLIFGCLGFYPYLYCIGGIVLATYAPHAFPENGFWGISRHVNYLGEIVQGIALALPGFLVLYGTTTPSWICMIPWIYPLYYTLLFIQREREDNALCKSKYGKSWDEYCLQVPYRIIPYVY
ncbi:hypothetical protein HK100_001784 [Physocladia obscura]|uniref:Uncharacterized protein n=1 Tax=Physocladia obscura TaxID=109957 RepID=A0AAD5TA40_9FUNG|nr:hypothetical protein HK100_001784 [Physocladia obscura]